MKNLIVEHLIPYLSFKLKCNAHSIDWDIEETNQQMFRIETGGTRKNPLNHEPIIIIGDSECTLDIIKPILRKLSSITNHEINELAKIAEEKNPDGFDNLESAVTWVTFMLMTYHNSIDNLPHFIIQKFYEWHLDVKGLIEKEIAIDIDTLNQIDHNIDKDKSIITVQSTIHRDGTKEINK